MLYKVQETDMNNTGNGGGSTMMLGRRRARKRGMGCGGERGRQRCGRGLGNRDSVMEALCCCLL